MVRNCDGCMKRPAEMEDTESNGAFCNQCLGKFDESDFKTLRRIAKGR